MEALRSSANPTHRQAALHALLGLWEWQGSEIGENDELSAAIRDDAGLTEALRQRSTPPDPDPEHENIRRETEKWERKERRKKLIREGRERQRVDKFVQWKKRLLANPEAAFSSEELPTTMHKLVQFLKSPQGGTLDHFNVWDENSLRIAFNEDIALLAA